jgi:hypothetical protein
MQQEDPSRLKLETKQGEINHPQTNDSLEHFQK